MLQLLSGVKCMRYMLSNDNIYGCKLPDPYPYTAAMIYSLFYGQKPMFSGLKSVFGIATISERDNTYVVEGISTDRLVKYINRTYDTTKITRNMFIEISTSRISFPKFFLVEFLFMLTQMTEDKKAPGQIKRLATRLITQIYTTTYASKFNDDTPVPDILDFSRLKNLKMKPMDAQMAFLKVYNKLVSRYSLRGYLASMPPGTGKTFTSICLGECLDADLRIYIVPKNSLDRVWRAALYENFDPKTVYIVNDPGPVPLDPKVTHYVFHYEALEQALSLVYKKVARKTFITLDECHNMNDIKSQRTLKFLDLCEKATDVNILWMSGTPLKALGSEVIPLLKSIDPFFDDDAAERFGKIFGMKKATALEILNNRMGLVTFKIPKKMVVEAEPIIDYVSVKLPNSDRYTLEVIQRDIQTYIIERQAYYKKNFTMYEQMYEDCLSSYYSTLTTTKDKDEFNYYRKLVNIIKKNYDPMVYKAEITWCNKYEDKKIIPVLNNQEKKDFRSSKTVIKCLHLKIQGEALGNILGKRRAECHTAMTQAVMDRIVDIVEDADKKTVIFSSFVETMTAAFGGFKGRGYEPLMVYGGTNAQLNLIIREFELNASYNPLCATYKSLSTAVPLIMANTMILLDEPFRDYIYDQAISRINRLGQDTQTYVYKLTLDTGNKPNISTRSADILEWSRQQIAAIMGDANTSINLDEYMDRALHRDFKETDSMLDGWVKGILSLFK